METISQVGIDVSKDSLVVRTQLQKPFSIKNDETEISKLAQSLASGSVVHMESTGGYERKARRILEAHCFKVLVHNPRKVRRLADALGLGAKTDPIDATFLQANASKLSAVHSKSLEQEELMDVSRSIGRLKTCIADHKKFIVAEWKHPTVVEAYRRIIRQCEQEVLVLEKLFVSKVKASQQAQAYKLAKSVPCVGPVLARVIVSELPTDIAECTAAQISSYCGVAPMDNSSGKKDGKKRIGKGNKHLKAALYMPAVVAVTTQTWARELYARLKAKGRTHRQAIVATMRKLLTQIVAVLKRGTPWNTIPIKTP
jgi:transposase